MALGHLLLGKSMKTLIELRADRAEKLKAVSLLSEKMNAENYTETAEDTKAYDDGVAAIKALDTKIDRLVQMETLKGSTAAPVPGQQKGPDGLEIEGNKIEFPNMARYGRLVSFKGAKAEEDAYKSGQFILATMFGKDHPAAERAREWCKGAGMIANLKAQAEGQNTVGGFLVPTEFERSIIDLREEYGTFRNEVRVVPMGSDSMTIPRRAGGVTAYFVGENSQITESQKGWGQVTLAAKKLGALIRYSTELSEDAIISIADDLAQEIAYAFAQKEDDCGWNGDGTATYGGITGVIPKFVGAGLAGGVDAASGHDTFAEIDAADLANVMAKLPKYAEKTAKWYVSQPGWALVFQRLLMAAGGNTMEIIAGKAKRTYMGYEIVVDQSLPTATTAINASPMLFFGDLRKAATMGERRGVRIKSSDDRYFELDQIGIQGTERFDLNVHDVGSTTAAGPLVALMGKT